MCKLRAFFESVEKNKHRKVKNEPADAAPVLKEAQYRLEAKLKKGLNIDREKRLIERGHEMAREQALAAESKIRKKRKDDDQGLALLMTADGVADSSTASAAELLHRANKADVQDESIRKRTFKK